MTASLRQAGARGAATAARQVGAPHHAPRCRFGRDEGGVTDVLGSILMVGITVAMVGGLALLLNTLVAPPDTTHADLVLSLDPGANGWGTGDEQVVLLHRGGEQVLREHITVAVQRGALVNTFSGATLGSGFADGKLTTGESWSQAYTINQAEQWNVDVIDSAEGSHLLSTAQLLAAPLTAGSCSPDTQAPQVAVWTQAPADVTATTSGSVAVTATLVDPCSGVDAANIPHLFWRINPGTNPPYADQGPMTSAPGSQWSGTIPAQTWSSLSGQNLQYYVSPLKDLRGNTGVSDTRTDHLESSCPSDVTAPSVGTWVRTPADVTTLTSGPVTVRATVTDDCSGVDDADVPHLFWRLDDGSDPPFTDQGVLSLVATHQWEGSVPSQTWASKAGQDLEYYVSPIGDLNGNTGASATQVDTVQTVTATTYVASNTPTTGTVSQFASAQSATDGGLEAALTEGGSLGSPTTATFDANAVLASSGWTNPTNSFVADDVYGTTTGNGNTLHVALQDPLNPPGTITQVVVRAEVSITNFANDRFDLQACLSGTCSTISAPIVGAATDITISYDVTNLRPGGGAWVWSDITNLEVKVVTDRSGGSDGTWRVDRVWASVSASPTVYALSVVMDFTGVPSGNVHTLQLAYRTTGETFNVQVWDGAAYTTRGTALNAGATTTWSYTLTVAEYNAGAPRIRFVDANPTGGTQGQVFLDYVRVVTS